MSNTGRTLIIKSDGRGEPFVIENFEGMTFGEVKAASAKDVSYDNARVILNNNKADLVDDAASIPLEFNPVVIFVVPQNMKGGATERQNLMAQAKKLIVADGDDARAHFGQYQMLSTDSLKALIDSYDNSDSAASKEVATEGTTVGETTEGAALTEALANLATAQTNVNNAVNTVLSLALGEDAPTIYGGFNLEQLNKAYEAQKSKTPRAKK